MAAKVYLADLRYNYSGVLANDCMPLGIAYMKAVMDRDLPGHEVESRLFVYPDRLLDAIKREPPDVLMLSNYVWNEALSLFVGKFAKQVRPDTLVVMGGPNISQEADRQIEWFSRQPEIDVYVLGEGDFLAAEMVRQYMAAGLTKRKFGREAIPSCLYRDPDAGVHRNETWDRHKQVDEIPSPWLTGIQDEFFDGKLAPMIETNRGCPFTCTFCAQGSRWYGKIHNFSIERMKEEIHYIARMIKAKSPAMGTLRIADSNYGMFERDIEISGFIGEMQRDYGWPTFIDATTGKNKPDRIIKSLEKVSGALVLYQAVQSLDEDVLRNVKRSAIKLEAYEQLQVHMRGRGLRSTSDLILGLPGESLKTHLAALFRLLDGNIDSLHNFQAMMLKGAEMETRECRDQFQFLTRFRVLPKNFGVYEGEKVLDVEEIIVGTDTLPFDDYVTARKYHLVSSVFWNDSWFEHPLRIAKHFGVKPSLWWSSMLPAMEQGSPAVRNFLDEFVGETKNELFETREVCAEHYKRDDNFKRLCHGEIGDNLMYKYRALASFHIWKDISATAMATTRRLLEQCGASTRFPHFDEFWDDFTVFVECKHADGYARDEVLGSRTAVLRYDFEAWLREGDLGDPTQYRLAEPTRFEFRLSPEARRELAAALDVWSMELKGLTKLVTRINVACQIRHCVMLGETRELGVAA